jgi:endogenous inhibitor of DNA gyrase (YacG/DUF329 family)
VRCPICKKTIDPDKTPTRPFCSPRCRQVDLGRWLGEEYAVAQEVDDEEEQTAEEGGYDDT